MIKIRIPFDISMKDYIKRLRVNTSPPLLPRRLETDLSCTTMTNIVISAADRCLESVKQEGGEDR